ncbi:MAG: hypothetical protein ACXWRE_05825 [Pseudobdellovibrionaceae bacterium]
MIKLILATAFMVSFYGQAQAEALRPSNIIGQYKVISDLGIQKYYLNFHVIGTQEFEMQRTYPNGNTDEMCNGTYNMDSRGVKHVFRGEVSCPSNRSRQMTFTIDFQDKTTDDLINGTTVIVMTSAIPNYPIHSYLKKK